ncbi:hypothetical protein [Actinomadura sp. 21ATH]|uniref:hypothetical protein n=1 Tax=Actinomadura sp. 21ATH TaxID=1735444 RepID=UPI0035C06002
MDRCEGPARLEWWANRHTCLASVDVRVTVTADDSGWHTTASLVSPLTGEDREGWDLLMTASPYCGDRRTRQPPPGRKRTRR